MSTSIATKQDITVELAKLETTLTKEIASAQHKTILWLGGWAAFIATVSKLL